MPVQDPVVRPPTIRDVAREAGVSPGTVSNVLTGRRGVRPDPAHRVREAVARLGYRGDPAASALRSAERRVVGALIPDLTNPFFATLVAELEVRARESKRGLLIATSCNSPAEEAAQIKALLAWRPAGLLVVPCDGDFAARTLMARAAVPYVVVDRLLDDEVGLDTVAVDNAVTAEAVTRRLLELGHRDILAVASTRRLRNMRERIEGMRAAVVGVPDARLEVVEAGLEVDQIAPLVAEVLCRRPAPTAIVALNNTCTLEVLKALRAQRLEVPGDVSLIGFDDHDWMDLHEPPIAAVRQPVAEMATLAWMRLKARIEGSPCVPCGRLTCRLAWRASVAAPAPFTPAVLKGTAPSGRRP